MSNNIAKQLAEGDAVQLADRDVTNEDTKSGLFFNHYRGLKGIVQKIYASTELAVEIDQTSLEETIATRHDDIQQAMKKKWMDGLSEEGRNRLSPKERDFRLRYSVLVAMKDVQLISE